MWQSVSQPIRNSLMSELGRTTGHSEVRLLGAKVEKIIVASCGYSKFSKDAVHASVDGLVVGVEWFRILWALDGTKALSGSQQGLDGFFRGEVVAPPGFSDRQQGAGILRYCQSER